MRRGFPLGLCLLAITSSLYAIDKPESIDAKATHEHTSVIKIAQGDDDNMKVNAFCLGRVGHIIAACGAGPGEIRVLNDEGELLNSWKLDIKPEAINTSAEGTILVGGEGKLLRFDSNGKLLHQAESPHAENLRSKRDDLRQEAIAYLNRSRNSVSSRVILYQQVLDQLEAKAAKSDLNDQEKRTLELLPEMLEALKKQLALQPEKNKNDKKPSEAAIKQQMDTLLKSKMRIASISTDEKDVFIATREVTGYGFAVWKLNKDFTGGEEIVTGLRGCCGQMDVQACANGLFVAENARHRVVRYDTSGTEVTTWGKGDRKGIQGFTSCCNPMNVCFNKRGDVLTAESSSGRIKRYNPDGELIAFVGDVKLVPGCKNVSIAASNDDATIYMLDLTRNHIIVMKQKADSTTEDTAAGTGE